MEKPYKIYIIILYAIFILIVGTVNNSNAEKSAFTHFIFGSDVSIDIPHNWHFLDNNIREHLNTYSEAVVRLAGLPAAQGDNKILIAANAYKNSKAPSATVRLSARRGDFISQSDVVGATDLDEVAMVAKFQLAKLNKSLPDSVNSINLVGVRIEKLGKYYSIVTEKTIDYKSGLSIDRLDVIYFSNVVYKLNTSYREKDAWMFESIIKIIRESLSISN